MSILLCDVGTPQQDVLFLNSRLANHEFRDQLGRLKPEWYDRLTSMMPEQGVAKETAMAADKEMYELTLKKEKDLFLNTSYCVKCDACCHVFRQVDRQDTPHPHPHCRGRMQGLGGLWPAAEAMPPEHVDLPNLCVRPSEAGL